MNYETTAEIEIALSKFFGIRQNLIVPNISWGMFNYELDLIVVSWAGYGTEIEIKISRSDLKKDKEKEHGHFNNRIKKFYFAIPEKLGVDFALKHIPERAGLIIIKPNGKCRKVKECTNNKNVIKFTNDEMYTITRLGSMRIWKLKEKIIKNKG